MRFMSLFKPGKESTAPPSQQEMADMGRLIEDMTKAGVLLATDGLQPSAKGSRVRLAEEKFTVTDGPFAETKELVAGYAIIEVNSKAEAIELTKKFLKVVGGGECEIRLMHDASGFCSEEPQQAATA